MRKYAFLKGLRYNLHKNAKILIDLLQHADILLHMKADNSTLQQETGGLLTTKEVAAIVRVSPVTIQRLAAAGKIPGTLKRNGKQYLIPRSSVSALLQPN